MGLGIHENMWKCEPQKVSRYVQGLKLPFREMLELSPTLWTIDKENSKALKVKTNFLVLRNSFHLRFAILIIH